jgi:hypothetical protein
MANYRTSRILPAILVIVIAIVAIAALVSLARVIFFSGPAAPEVPDTSRDTLLSTGDGYGVTMSVRGPIVANEEFHSYQISVSNNNRSIKTYTGYLDSIVDQINLGNNVAAYEEFVHALDKADLADGTELEGDRNDVRGICATGRVYEFTILDDNKSVKRLWTSTCKGSQGSLDASVDQLRQLFVKQIPDADKLIDDVNL